MSGSGPWETTACALGPVGGWARPGRALGVAARPVRHTPQGRGARTRPSFASPPRSLLGGNVSGRDLRPVGDRPAAACTALQTTRTLPLTGVDQLLSCPVWARSPGGSTWGPGRRRPPWLPPGPVRCGALPAGPGSRWLGACWPPCRAGGARAAADSGRRLPAQPGSSLGEGGRSSQCSGTCLGRVSAGSVQRGCV